MHLNPAAAYAIIILAAGCSRQPLSWWLALIYIADQSACGFVALSAAARPDKNATKTRLGTKSPKCGDNVLDRSAATKIILAHHDAFDAEAEHW